MDLGGPGKFRFLRSALEKPEESLPEDLLKTKLYQSTNHWRNFLQCVKSRQPTITPVETAHHSAIPATLSLISMLTGRKLRWDVASEKILDDPDAAMLLTRPIEPPGTWPERLGKS
jgi:hypothetical protein